MLFRSGPPLLPPDGMLSQVAGVALLLSLTAVAALEPHGGGYRTHFSKRQESEVADWDGVVNRE